MSRVLRRLPALLVLCLLALPTAAQARSRTTYYVSLGDSWAQGVQPVGANMADVATNQGFTDDLYRTLRKRHPGLKLVKLGCGGATTTSMIDGSKPCVEKLPYRSRSKASSQLTYAESFLRRHRKQIAFVTVIIGGNDVAPCAAAADNQAIVTCVTQGIQQIKANLPVIARDLRRAAGPKAAIVGSTYADVVLGQYVKSANGQSLAKLSVDIFRQQINPALKSAYGKQHIGFVDATSGFGGYVPFDQTTELAPYGQIPQAVASICTLGWYCADRPGGPDIHLRAAGYSKLAGMFDSLIRREHLG